MKRSFSLTELQKAAAEVDLQVISHHLAPDADPVAWVSKGSIRAAALAIVVHDAETQSLRSFGHVRTNEQTRHLKVRPP